MTATANSILVIDDDQAILDVVRLVLEQADYKVITSNKSDILSLIKKHQPQLVLLDNWLHNTDGLHSISLIKNQYKNLPVVMMSANPEIRNQAEKAGVNAFIDKPFDIQDLTHTISEILN